MRTVYGAAFGLKFLVLGLILGPVISAGADLELECNSGKAESCVAIWKGLLSSKPELDETTASKFFHWVLNGCRLGEKASCAWWIENSPVLREDFWQSKAPMGASLAERHLPVSPELLDYLSASAISSGYSEKAQAIEVPPDWLRDFNEAVRGLPRAFVNLVSPKLLGFALVKDLGSSAFTFETLDADARPQKSVVALDVGRLLGGANDWHSSKDASVFSSDTAFRIRVTAERKGDDSRKELIQYLLLHELAHVAAINEGWAPYWRDRGRKPEGNRLEKHPFTRISWKDGRDHLASREEKSFPERPKIRFYASSRDQLPISDAGTIYRKLAGTRFPTLYSSTNPEEDFAESLANYVHVVIQKKPYRVEVLKGETVIQANGHCWDESRCASKKKFFDALFSKPTSPAK